MKMFECIVDDGKNVYKARTPMKSKKELLDVYGGNGEFVSIKDVTKDYFTDESVYKLRNDLLREGWGEPEQSFICALLEEHLRSIGKI